MKVGDKLESRKLTIVYGCKNVL